MASMVGRELFVAGAEAGAVAEDVAERGAAAEPAISTLTTLSLLECILMIDMIL